MGASGGPKIELNGLKFILDVSSKKSVSAIGMEGWNGAPQAFKNIINQSQNIQTISGSRLGNVTPFTIFAIDYPEGNYGGAAASRDGIQEGFNVTSGTRVRNYSRALNYAVWNEDTNAWLATSYFNGSRDSGHCYDTYSWSGEGGATAQVGKFVTDYNTLKAAFPNGVHVVAGSHRDITHTNDQYDVLRDLGAPSTVNTIIGSGSPEWILVGKPGLGAGNAYAWAFQNYDVNPTQVAHVNVGLPTFGTGKNNYIEFNGSEDFLQASMTNGTSNHSCEAWFWLDATNNQNVLFNTNGQGLYPRIMYHSGAIKAQYNNGSTRLITGPSLSTNTWHHALFTYDSSVGGKFWVNGVYIGANTNTGALGGSGVSSYNMNIGYDSNLDDYLNGRVASVKIYNVAINPRSVLRNFRSKKKRHQ